MTYNVFGGTLNLTQPTTQHILLLVFMLISKMQTLFVWLAQEEKTGLPACYTQNPLSMLRYEYDCVFFVARKIVPSC